MYKLIVTHDLTLIKEKVTICKAPVFIRILNPQILKVYLPRSPLKMMVISTNWKFCVKILMEENEKAWVLEED